jgi:arylsulfatase A-like enzyme
VGQKLIQGATIKGGYTDAAADPTGPMKDEIRFVDASIGKMVTELNNKDLLESTLIIVTAKHGQSPIDTHRFTPIPGAAVAPTPPQPPSYWISSLLPASETTDAIGPTEDDISLLWLNHSGDTVSAVGTLETHALDAGIGEIFYGASLLPMYYAPGLPTVPGPCCQLRAGGDPRTPDIIVQPNVGVVFTGNKGTKQAEHGGFAQDDTNVMLLVSNTEFRASTVTSFVETTQVAPTILQALGLDPEQLQGVQKEGTPVLPGLSFEQ